MGSQADMAEFYTVVYRVEGGKQQHDAWWQSVQQMFLTDDPISITMIAACDLSVKLDDLESREEKCHMAYVRNGT